MPAPSYSDLGKSARDVFNKGYHFGVFKLECKTKTPNDIKITVNGENSVDSNKVSGNLETEYKVPSYGLTVKEKWTTENILSMDLSIEDQILEGLKLSTDMTFAPSTGKKSAKLKTSYKHENVNLSNDFDLLFPGPTIHSGAVLHYNGWLAGAQLSYDTGKKQLTKNNFAFGYQAGDFVMHANVNDGTEFGGSIYQKLNKRLESSVMLSWTSGSNATKFALGSKYVIDKHTNVRAKVNNNCQVGLSYQQTIRDGVKLTLSSLVEAKNLSAGSHKLGAGLEFDT